MAKIKSCESCNQPFKGRSNAKTCSDRCRKRLQRTKKQLAREFKTEVKRTAKKIEVLIDDTESLLEPAGSTEEGFIGDGAGAATSSFPTNKSTSAVGPPPASINSTPVSPPVQTAAPPGLFSGSLEYDRLQQQRPISQASIPSVNLSASATAADAAEPLITQPTFSPPSQPRLADNPKRIRQFAKPSRLAWALTTTLVITLAGFSLFILNRSGQSSNTLKKPISSQASASTQNTLGDIESESLSFSIDTTVAKGKKFTATGPVAIQNEANSSHAFTIQTASGDNLLVADTKSKQIGINTVPSGNAALQVGGDIAASGNVTAAGVIAANGGATSLSNSGLRINNVLICTAAGCRNLAAQAASGQVFTGDAKTLSGHPASYFVSAANLTGVINDSHLSGNVALQNSNNTFTQINSFTAAGNTFVGDGSGLSAVDAAKLGGHDSTYYANASNLSSGTLNDSLLSNNVALLDADNNFTGANTFNGTTTQNGSYLFRSATNSLTAFQIQNAAGNDNLLVADTINTRVGIGLSPQYTLDVNGDINIAAGQSFRVGGTPICNSSGCAPSSGSNSYVQLQGNTPGSAQSGNLNVSGSAIAGSFYGNGLGLTSLNASELTSGTVNDSRLSGNVALLSLDQVFTGANVFSNVSNSFSGDGSGLANVDAAQLNGQAASYYQNASNINAGTLADTRLSSNVTLQGNTFNGASQLVQLDSGGLLPVLDGSNLTNLDGSSISSGTVADARLSSNVALLGAASQTFTGANIFSQIINAPGLETLNSGHTIAVGFSGVATGDITYNFDNSVAPGTYAICTTVGNCAGTGTGVTSSGGTTNKLAKFTAGQAIGDSSISDDGTTVTLGAKGLVQSSSTTAFQVQKADGTGTTVAVDTANGRLAVNQSSAIYTLDVAGDINTTGVYRVNGTQISSANLSNDSNLTKNDANNTLTGSNTFSGANTFSNSSNSFTGNGSGLTNVNAAQLNGQTGSYYTDAGNLSTGILNDARLSGNVALKNANNNFTGDNSFTLATTALTIQDASTPLGADLFTVTDNTGVTKYFSISAAGAQVNGQDVCTTSGNCAGAGTGVTTAGGTAGTIALFTAAQAIGDSILTQSGTTVTVGGTLNATLIQQGGVGVILQNTSFGGTGGDISGTYNDLVIGNGAVTSAKVADGTLTDIDISNTAAISYGKLNLAGSVVNSDISASAAIAYSKLNLTGSITNSDIASGANISDSKLATISSAGKVADSALSSNVALRDADNVFTGNNSFSSAITVPSITTAGASLGVGTSSASLNLAGDASSTLVVTGSGGFTTTIGFSGTPTGNVAYNFDLSATPGTYVICTTVGNCSSAGGGVTTVGGTANQLVKFSGAQTIVNSSISDDGTTVAIAANGLVKSTGTTAFEIQKSDGTGNLFVADTTNGRIAIGQATASHTLDVNGSINGTGVYQNGNQVCDTSGNCVGTGGTGGAIGGSGTANKIALFTGAGTIGDSTLSQSGSTVTGTNLNVTGMYQVNGTQITSAVLSNDSDLAKLDGNQTFTGSDTFTGTTIVKADSATAFQVQNTSGIDMLQIDTTNSRVGIGAVSGLTATLEVRGPSGSTTTLRLDNADTGSTVGFIQVDSNGLSFQDRIGNLSISSAGSTTISSGGSATVQSTTNSTTAFQVQNATGTNELVVDTTNQRVAVGPSAVPANGVLTIGTNTTTASGGIYFGTDTNLYRSATNVLSTEDSFTAGGNLQAGVGAKAVGGTGGLILATNQLDGRYYNIGTGGTNQAYLYFTGVNSSGVRTDWGGVNIDLNQVGLGINPTNSDYGTAVIVGANSASRKALVVRGADSQTADILQVQGGSGDVQAAFNSSGQLVFGPSGSQDTNLYRSAANLLQTDDKFQANGSFRVAGNGIAVGSAVDPGNFANSEFYGVGASAALGVRASSTGTLLRLQNNASSDILTVDSSAKLTWFGDTNLYRSAANRLQTDDDFYASNMVASGFIQGSSVIQAASDICARYNDANTKTCVGNMGPAGQAGIKLGTAGDTNLYRAGAGQLKTDGQFYASTDILAGASGGGNFLQNANVGFQSAFIIERNSSYIGGITTDGTNQIGLAVGGVAWSNAVLKLSSTGAATFQNATDSTSAFTVNNSGGTTVLGVDTLNQLVSVTNLQSSGTISLQGPDGGSILLRTAANSGLGTGNTMTFSGNEITDKTRSAATQGDGRQPPDSSTGIWEATTNLITNGGFESNTTGWGGFRTTSTTRDTSVAKFGSASLKVVTNATYNDGGPQFNITNSAGTYTYSAWVLMPAGIPFNLDTNNVGGPTVTATGSWQHVTWTFTGDGTSAYNNFLVQQNTSGAQSVTFWIDGAQVEQKGYATPYVETNGSTATRARSTISAPGSLLNSSNGWFSARVRLGVSSSTWHSNGANPAIFNWQQDGNNWLILYYWSSGQEWIAQARVGGTSFSAGISDTFNIGDIRTVAMTWGASGVGISLGGSNFTMQSTSMPVISQSNTFDIGEQSGNNTLDSDILWTAAGTGTLSNADASALYKLGNSDPSVSGINSIDSASTPTFAWDGESTQYSGANNAPTLQSGISIDDVNLYHSANGSLSIQGSINSTTAFQVQNASGTSILTVDTKNGRVNFPNATSSSTGVFFGSGDELYSTGGTLKTLSKFWSTALGVGYDPNSITGGVAAFNGSVGIGTSSPGQTLDVENNSNSTGQLILASNVGANAVAGITFSTPYSGTHNGGIYSSFYGQTVNGAMVQGITFQSPRDIIGGGYGFNFASNSGTSRVFIDTTSGKVGIGTTGPNYPLDVTGDINSSTGLRVGGNLVCDSGGCAASGGSGLYIQLQASTPGTAQSGNFNINGTAIAGYFQGDGSGLTSLNGSQVTSGTVADARLSSNVDLLNVSQVISAAKTFNGTALFQNTANSPTAFQIQKSDTTALLVANDNTGQILLPNATLSSTALLLGGNANLYAPSNGNLKTDNNLTIAGIGTVSGVLNANAGGKTAITIADSGAQNSGLTIGGDTNLYRSGSGILQTDSRFIAQNYIQSQGQAAGSAAFRAQATGDSQYRVQIDNTGALTWGPGTGPIDTNLYRSAAGILRTGGAFVADSSISSTAGSGRNAFGGAALSNTILSVVNGGSGGQILAAIQGASNQSGDLLQLQNSSGGTLSKFNSNGNLQIGGTISAASTTALQVLNPLGGQVLGADTTNQLVNVTNLQASGTIALQGPDGGSILLRTAANSGTGSNAMTFSGNEITDKTRSNGVQGDGRQAPDSSTGIWESTTNLVTNGGFESNTTGLSTLNSTLASSTDTAKFGSHSVKVTATSSGSGWQMFNIVTGSPVSQIPYTGSVWVKGSGTTIGQTLDFQLNETGGASATGTLGNSPKSQIVLTSNWQKVTYTGTATQTDRTSIYAILALSAGSSGDVFYADGFQVEQKSIATPYVETNGATATRSAARIQAPASNLNATQGWYAARFRAGFNSSSPPNGNNFVELANWWDGTANNRVTFGFNGSARTFEVWRAAGGVTDVASTPASFSTGDLITVVGRWDNSTIYISAKGATFTSVASTHIPTTLNSSFDIGGRDGTSSAFDVDGDILWFASGTGTLTNADASALNAYGNNDPTLSSLSSMDSAATPTFAWDGESAGYSGANNAPVLQSGISIDDVNLYHSANGSISIQGATNSTTAFQVQNAASTSVFDVDTTNGRVGIGTAAPGYQLEVKGTGSATDGIAITTSGYSLIPNEGTIANSIVINGRGINITADNATVTSTVGEGLGIAVNRAGAALAVQNASGYSAIFESGNVGIGNTSPQEALDVTGRVRGSGDIYTTGEGATRVGFLNASGSTAGTTYFGIDYDAANNAGRIQALSGGVAWRNLELNPNGGNVGVQTTNPQQPLDVNGPIRSFHGVGYEGYSTEIGTLTPSGYPTVGFYSNIRGGTNLYANTLATQGSSIWAGGGSINFAIAPTAVQGATWNPTVAGNNIVTINASGLNLNSGSITFPDGTSLSRAVGHTIASTSSTANMSIAINTCATYFSTGSAIYSGGPVRVEFMLPRFSSNGGDDTIYLLRDGSTIDSILPYGGTPREIDYAFYDTPSAGSHAYGIYICAGGNGSGSATVQSAVGRTARLRVEVADSM